MAAARRIRPYRKCWSPPCEEVEGRETEGSGLLKK